MSDTSHKGKRWIGVDWDRTLMTYTTWEAMGVTMGKPVKAMWERVRRVLAVGEFEVRIFTARACDANWHRDDDLIEIRRICVEQLGVELPITCQKDFAMAAIWDDIAVPCGRNIGVWPLDSGHPHMAYLPPDPLLGDEEWELMDHDELAAARDHVEELLRARTAFAAGSN